MNYLTPERNLALMKRMSHLGTKPQFSLGKALHQLDLRYVIGDMLLLGTSALAFPKYMVALLVHGYLWLANSEGPPRITPSGRALPSPPDPAPEFCE